MVTPSFLLVVGTLLLVSNAKAQLQLMDFYEVEQALLDGHEVQVVIDLTDGGSRVKTRTGIETKFDLFDATTISLPLAPWNRLTLLDAAVSWHFSRSFITQDGKIGAYFVELTNFFGLTNAIVLEKIIDPVTFESIATADYGTQAVEYYCHTLETGSQIDANDYEVIKDALTSGDGTISIVVNITACDPNELPVPIDKYDVIVGVPAVDRFYVGYPGGSDEGQFIATYASTISYDYGDFDLVYQRATNAYYIFPNGTVVVHAEALYGPDGPGVQGSFTTVCTLGEGVRVQKNVKQTPEVITDFTALKDTLSNGRQLRVIVDERSCGAPADPNMPFVAGYDVPSWELFLDPQFGPEPFLGFSQNTFLEGGVLLLDEARVFESGRLEVTFTNIDTATSTTISNGVVSCELGDSNYFVTLDSPDKELLTSTSQVESAVLSGSTLQFVSPYLQCRDGPSVEAVGGSPVKHIAVGAGIATDAHSLISNYFTDEGLAFNSVPLYIAPSGVAEFYPALYDDETWQNLFPEGYTYGCDLFDGTEGSVYIYKTLY